MLASIACIGILEIPDLDPSVTESIVKHPCVRRLRLCDTPLRRDADQFSRMESLALQIRDLELTMPRFRNKSGLETFLSKATSLESIRLRFAQGEPVLKVLHLLLEATSTRRLKHLALLGKDQQGYQGEIAMDERDKDGIRRFGQALVNVLLRNRQIRSLAITWSVAPVCTA